MFKKDNFTFSRKPRVRKKKPSDEVHANFDAPIAVPSPPPRAPRDERWRWRLGFSKGMRGWFRSVTPLHGGGKNNTNTEVCCLTRFKKIVVAK